MNKINRKRSERKKGMNGSSKESYTRKNKKAMTKEKMGFVLLHF